MLLRIILLVTVVVIVLIVLPRLLSNSAAGIPPTGAPAPEFSLPSQDGTVVDLKSLRGKWVVLYFYPKDQTPGCTREAHNFQLDAEKYAQRNTSILGVSVDSVASHKSFCAKEGLNFKLLSDSNGQVSRQYGSLKNLGIAKFASRHTFLIDPNGEIAKAYTDVDPARHSTQVLSELDEMQKKY